MMAHNEVYLRCAQLANASRVLGNLGDDILSKITLKSGVGTIVETGSDDGHFMALRAPVTLRHMRFRLTDLDRGGQESSLLGTALRQAYDYWQDQPGFPNPELQFFKVPNSRASRSQTYRGAGFAFPSLLRTFRPQREQ